MKKTSFILCALSAAALGLSSCANLQDFNMAPNSAIGTVGESIEGTVVSARTMRAEASSTSKNLGTGIGTAVGAGSGALLGGGKGQIVSAVGFGVVGALAGREIGKLFNESTVQELSIRADNKRTYTITQPIYKQFGEIPTGTRGILTISGSNSRFVPYN